MASSYMLRALCTSRLCPTPSSEERLRCRNGLRGRRREAGRPALLLSRWHESAALRSDFSLLSSRRTRSRARPNGRILSDGNVTRQANVVAGANAGTTLANPLLEEAESISDASYAAPDFAADDLEFGCQVVHPQYVQHGRPTSSTRSSRLLVFPCSKEDSSAPVPPQLPLAKLIINLAIFVLIPGIFCGCAQASEAIKASSFGLKVASFLRRTGWPDEAIVFLLATLPVLELRGAIPVGYWMRMDPWKLSLLSVLGNMVPVPFLLLHLEKTAKFLSSKSLTAKRMVDAFFEFTRKKAAPVQEFEWLGLMLFVAVPFPGTGAWSGAMVASVLGMPFWEAMSANFCGVVMAGLLVNLLVNLGLNYAIIVGAGLFFISSFMWSLLRVLRRNKQ